MKTHLLEGLLDPDRKRDMPLHAQVRRTLERLVSEHFEKGERFFTETMLIDHMGVSQGTMRRALADLVAEGILDRHPAKGTYVGTRKPKVQSRIGVFIPSYDSQFTVKFLEEFSRFGRESGLRLDVFPLRQDEAGTQAMDHLHWGPQEGTIILLNNLPMVTWQLAEALHERNYRVITIDSVVKGFEEWSVSMDNEAAVEIGLEHLRELGHRRVAFLICESSLFPQVQERAKAFREIAPKKGFEYYPVLETGTQAWESSFDATYRWVKQFDWSQERITAVFCVSDQGAYAILRWAAEEGIRVPRDISVLGSDNQPTSSLVCPPLSTIECPVKQIAAKAIEMSLAVNLESKQPTLIPPGLILRSTTTAAPFFRN